MNYPKLQYHRVSQGVTQGGHFPPQHENIPFPEDWDFVLNNFLDKCDFSPPPLRNFAVFPAELQNCLPKKSLNSTLDNKCMKTTR